MLPSSCILFPLLGEYLVMTVRVWALPRDNKYLIIVQSFQGLLIQSFERTLKSEAYKYSDRCHFLMLRRREVR